MRSRILEIKGSSYLASRKSPLKVVFTKPYTFALLVMTNKGYMWRIVNLRKGRNDISLKIKKPGKLICEYDLEGKNGRISMLLIKEGLIYAKKDTFSSRHSSLILNNVPPGNYTLYCCCENRHSLKKGISIYPGGDKSIKIKPLDVHGGISLEFVRSRNAKPLTQFELYNLKQRILLQNQFFVLNVTPDVRTLKKKIYVTYKYIPAGRARLWIRSTRLRGKEKIVKVYPTNSYGKKKGRISVQKSYIGLSIASFCFFFGGFFSAQDRCMNKSIFQSTSPKNCAVIMGKDFGSQRGATMAHSPFL